MPGWARPSERRKTYDHGVRPIFIFSYHIFIYVSSVHKSLPGGVRFPELYTEYNTNVSEPMRSYSALFFRKNFLVVYVYHLLTRHIITSCKRTIRVVLAWYRTDSRPAGGVRSPPPLRACSSHRLGNRPP
jgi:hypothetical protein